MAETKSNPELPPGIVEQRATIPREEYKEIAQAMWQTLLASYDVMDALVIVEALFRTSAWSVMALGRGADGYPPSSFIASSNYSYVVGCVEKLRADLAEVAPKAN